MDNKRSNKKTSLNININNKGVKDAIKSISKICDIVDNIKPGMVSEKELPSSDLYEFSSTVDIFYSMHNKEGYYIADIIFRSFKELAYVLVRRELTQSVLDKLYKDYISVLRDFVNKNDISNSLVTNTQTIAK